VAAQDHEQAERFLLLMGDMGRRISEAMAGAVDDPSIVDNVSVLVLTALDLHGPLRPGRLSTITGMSSAGMTGVLDRLESRGLLRRSGGVAGDRRGVNVQLTPAGRRTIRKMARAAAGAMDEVLVFAKSLLAEADS
jgi:DNA-binding MarR family transcriptional regulator